MNFEQDFSSDEEDDDYNPAAGDIDVEGDGATGSKKAQKKGKRKSVGEGAGVSRDDKKETAAASTAPALGFGRGRAPAPAVDPLKELKEEGRKAKINDIWEQLKAKSGAAKPRPAFPVPTPTSQASVSSGAQAKGANTGARPPQQPAWMTDLLSTSKRETSATPSATNGSTAGDGNGAATSSAVSFAAAALAAAKASMNAEPVDRDGKIEVQETRDFAGETIVVKKLVDADSKIAKRKAEAEVASSRGLDALLAQIEKKKKLNILDKSRKDWGEFKEETGIVSELAEHKKSGDTYTEKVAFLQRADLREYEVERDLRLSSQSKRPLN